MTTEDQKNNSGLWLSIAEIARRKSVSRQAIAERVTRFEEAGSITTKPGKANAKLVNLAEFDRLAEEQTSFAKKSGARNGGGGHSRRGAYNDAITEKAQYDAELKRLELAERLKQMVPIEEVVTIAERSGEIVISVIEGLSRRADDITAAALAGQVRPLLKTIIFDMRTRIAAEFNKLADAANQSTRSAADATRSVQVELPLPVDDGQVAGDAGS